MKNTKKILAPFLVICKLFLAIIPASASDDSSGGDTKLPVIEPYWWLGNPTPQPGSEAWLQQNMQHSTGDVSKARKCALKALKGALIPGGVTVGVEKWLLKKSFSVGSFTLGFGISWAYGYNDCLYG